MPSARLTGVVAALLLASTHAAGPVHADEGERIFSIVGGVATFAADVGDNDSETEAGIGFGLGLDYERGLTKAMWLRISGGGAIYTGRPASLSGQGTIGLTYVFDVLKYIPYAHVGVGGVALYLDKTPEANEADRQLQINPLVELGAGLDILSGESMSWGAHLRLASFLDRTALFTLGLRVSWRWGFF